MEWNIEPLIGLGELKFGMTHDEVALILGNRMRFTRLIEDGSINEYREDRDMPVCNYHNGKLRCIDIYSMCYETKLNELRLFKDDPRFVIDYLQKMAGSPSVVFGICYFKIIGISLGKWIDAQSLVVRPKPDRANDLRSISVSARGTHFDIFTDDKIVSLGISSKL